MSITVNLTVNGKAVTTTSPENTTLVELLRESLSLTGTHVGCDTVQCGACTVHLDGRAVKACALLAAQCEGAEITTIEGLAGTSNWMRANWMRANCTPCRRRFVNVMACNADFAHPG